MKNSSSSHHIKMTALPEMIGQRLDKALSLIPEIGTRSRASLLLEKSLVLLNGKVTKPSALVHENDLIEIEIPPPPPQDLQPYNFKLDILFEDEDLLVVNKPSGLVVHPAAGHAHDTLVNALLAHTNNLSMKFGEKRPGIVHRLDKETSGILVVAKNDMAHESLAQQFKERSTHRIYYAVTLGTAKTLKGLQKSFLARHPTDRKKYASVRDDHHHIISEHDRSPSVGKWAVTHYDVLVRKGGLSYLRLKLETGRTHQIRVHLSELGLPIAGDTLYGADRKIKSLTSSATQAEVKNLPRFLLHAAELEFTHPRTEQRMSYQQDWPDDILPLLQKWGLR